MCSRGCKSHLMCMQGFPRPRACVRVGVGGGKCLREQHVHAYIFFPKVYMCHRVFLHVFPVYM